MGESSAAGRPYGSGYAFPAGLEARLRAELPDVPVEIVNAAVSGYVTRRMLANVRDIARLSPDLLVVYAGHNDLFARRFYAHLLRFDPRVFRVLELAVDTRLYQLLARLLPAPFAPGASAAHLEGAKDGFQMFRPRGSHPSARERAYAEMLYRFGSTMTTGNLAY